MVARLALELTVGAGGLEVSCDGESVTAGGPAKNPMRLSKSMTGELDGLRSARRGDYRVLLWVYEAAHSVVIVRVAHRADVHRAGPD